MAAEPEDLPVRDENDGHVLEDGVNGDAEELLQMEGLRLEIEAGGTSDERVISIQCRSR